MARNQYAGPCYECGRIVEPGTGHFERVPGNGWRVKHANVPGHGRVTCEMAVAVIRALLAKPEPPSPPLS